MYTLYTIPGSCSSGILMLLNKLKLDVNIIRRDDVSNYRELVPTNQVPALQKDDQILTEGASIVFYLLSKYGDTTEHNNTEFNQWLMFNYATMHPAYGKLFAVNANMTEGNEKRELMQRLANAVAALWEIVDRRLEHRQFMVGESPSIIDYLVTVYLRWGNAFPEVTIPVGDNVLRLVNQMIELPEVYSAFDRESVEYLIPENAKKS